MKIDVTKIEGYESMSAEEKLEALQNYEIDTKGYVKKDLYDKVASEVSTLKKERKESMSEAERKEAEREEMLASMQKELESLREEKQISELTSKYLALGYGDELAKDTAKAYLTGDLEKVFGNQKKYQETLEQKIKTDMLKATPLPTQGNANTQTMTLETFKKKSMEERMKFANENPDEYKKLYEGE